MNNHDQSIWIKGLALLSVLKFVIIVYLGLEISMNSDKIDSVVDKTQYYSSIDSVRTSFMISERQAYKIAFDTIRVQFENMTIESKLQNEQFKNELSEFRHWRDSTKRAQDSLELIK